ncbi:MAG: hypothetical protein GC186_00200 [Rhodobacteraceae bacterium]|nr:hypothetical protein [Paracoccaceae bacterium]
MIPLPALRAAVVALAVAAASSGTAGTFADPLAADPAAVRVALTLPPGFAVLPGSAELRMSATNNKTGETATAADALAATETPTQGVTLALATPATAQLSALEATVASWRAAHANPQAQITVTFTPCRTSPMADPAGPISLTLTLSPGGTRFALVQPGTTLAGYLPGGAATIEACPG